MARYTVEQTLLAAGLAVGVAGGGSWLLTIPPADPGGAASGDVVADAVSGLSRGVESLMAPDTPQAVAPAPVDFTELVVPMRDPSSASQYLIFDVTITIARGATMERQSIAFGRLRERVLQTLRDHAGQPDWMAPTADGIPPLMRLEKTLSAKLGAPVTINRVLAQQTRG